MPTVNDKKKPLPSCNQIACHAHLLPCHESRQRPPPQSEKCWGNSGDLEPPGQQKTWSEDISKFTIDVILNISNLYLKMCSMVSQYIIIHHPIYFKKTFPYCSVSTIFHVSPSVGLCPSGMETAPLLLMAARNPARKPVEGTVVEIPIILRTGFNKNNPTGGGSFRRISEPWTAGILSHLIGFLKGRFQMLTNLYRFCQGISVGCTPIPTWAPYGEIPI